MSSSSSSTQGELDVPNPPVDDAKGYCGAMKLESKIKSDGQECSEHSDCKQMGDRQAPAVLPCEGAKTPIPPHVRKSLDTALAVVAAQPPSSPATSTASPAPPPSTAGSNVNLAQITDILLARLITTLSDSALGNPALLLQTLLGFSPEDYNDLLAALSESGSSYVDIIAAYLHNIRVMSEDSGSTSAALSNTLTQSLIEQYNSLLSQALRAPRNQNGRSGLTPSMGEILGQGNVGEMMMRPTNGMLGSVVGRPGIPSPGGRRPYDVPMNRGPSGLGFGRRSLDSARLRQGIVLDPSAQTLGMQRMVHGDPTPLTPGLEGHPIHPRRPASVDLGEMLGGGDGTAPGNPALLHQHVLAGHNTEQLASLLQTLPVLSYPFVHPGVTAQMPCDPTSSLGGLNPPMGLMAPTMPAIPVPQPGLGAGLSSLPNGVTAAHVLAGHGIIPPWPNVGPINGHTTVTPLHLMRQTGAVPQPWDHHMATIHENGRVAMTPEQAVAVAAVAGPPNGINSQGFPVANGGVVDGFAGIDG